MITYNLSKMIVNMLIIKHLNKINQPTQKIIDNKNETSNHLTKNNYSSQIYNHQKFSLPKLTSRPIIASSSIVKNYVICIIITSNSSIE